MVGTLLCVPLFYYPVKILENDLPLFPLHTVLFPHARLPLHIFEPRYREMIDRCLREDLAFGVLLIKEGVEVGGAAIPYSIGTVAQIVDAEHLPDGRMNIVTHGVVRFRLLEQFDTHPYLSGHIELIPQARVDQAEVEAEFSDVRRIFAEYVQMFNRTNEPGDEPELNLPDDPAVLSYLVAAVLPLNMLEKQKLLEIDSTRERLERELVLLRREIELLRLAIDNSRTRNQGSFSLN